jgi:hypothetical protein
MGSKGAFWPWLILFFLIAGGFAYLFVGGYFGLPQPSLPRFFGLRPTPAVVTPDGRSLQVGPDGKALADSGTPVVETLAELGEGEMRIPEFALGLVRPIVVGRVLTDLEAQGYSEVDQRREPGQQEILLVKENEIFVLLFEQEGDYLRWSTQPSDGW